MRKIPEPLKRSLGGQKELLRAHRGVLCPSDAQWRRAKLAVRNGGLGLRSARQLTGSLRASMPVRENAQGDAATGASGHEVLLSSRGKRLMFGLSCGRVNPTGAHAGAEGAREDPRADAL